MYIIMELLMTNGMRAGAVANMNNSEFESGNWERGQFTVRVKKHKTADTFGPAPVVFSRTLYDLTLLYRRYVRPQEVTLAVDTCRVFVLSTGSVLNLAQELTRHWHSVTGQRRRVNASSFRKGTTTAARQGLNDQSFHSVNRHMAHSTPTALSHYEAQSSDRDAVVAVELIEKAKAVAKAKAKQQQEANKDNTAPPSPSHKAIHIPLPHLQIANSNRAPTHQPSDQPSASHDQSSEEPQPSHDQPPPPDQPSCSNDQPPASSGVHPAANSLLPRQQGQRRSKRFPAHVMDAIMSVFAEEIKRRKVYKPTGYTKFMANLQRLPTFNSNAKNTEKREEELRRNWQSVYDMLRRIIKEMEEEDESSSNDQHAS
ncbi:uncharacterized protein [Amphiura filiformis]|uniref:uncharacterized protein n=1 Tax=Amphiura filiformis TaxID=82378 RepID=UPI003B2185CC